MSCVKIVMLLQAQRVLHFSASFIEAVTLYLQPNLSPNTEQIIKHSAMLRFLYFCLVKYCTCLHCCQHPSLKVVGKRLVQLQGGSCFMMLESPRLLRKSPSVEQIRYHNVVAFYYPGFILGGNKKAEHTSDSSCMLFIQTFHWEDPLLFNVIDVHYA